MSDNTLLIIAVSVIAMFVCPAKQPIPAARSTTICRCAKIRDASDWLSNSAFQTNKNLFKKQILQCARKFTCT